MEKAGIRKSLLPTLYSNQRHQFFHQLHLPGTKNQIRRRKNCRMCTLRLQRLLRMKNIIMSSKYTYFQLFIWLTLSALRRYGLGVKLLTNNYRHDSKHINENPREFKIQENPRKPKKISSNINKPKRGKLRSII